jgi:hypothetical protein
MMRWARGRSIEASLLALLLAACPPTQPRTDDPVPVPPPPKGKRVLTLEQYEDLVYGPGPQATFKATTAGEHSAVESLIPRMLEGARAHVPADPHAWQAEAQAGGFRIDVWTIEGETYWALLEAPPIHGAGAYIVRVGGARETGPTILLQAPHNFFDMGTGHLAAVMFFGKREGARPRALFTNTIHRYQLAPGDKKKRKHNPADVAHQPDHAFTIATLAFARAADRAHVIQLHGFGARIEDDDDDKDPGAIAMVISAGDHAGSSPLSAAIADALVKLFGPDVKRFPEEAKVLGATTNAQGKLLRALPNARFIHVEMSAEMRKRFAGDAAARQQLAAALFDTGDPK